MRVHPLATESLGVRSMATYVECGQTRLLIDPGASLGEHRFGLPPSDAEWEALRRANDRVSGYAARADWLFVSHYHEDHFRYDPQIYDGKSVWAKDPRRMINPGQGQRGLGLWREIAGRCRLDAAEGRRWETPDCVLAASPPLSHGVDGSALGYVVALTVTDRREGFRFVHASDVQGPLSPVAAAYLMRERPHLLYLSGPPSYLERQVGSALIDTGIEHLLRIVDRCGCRVIMDHHALRDDRYRERFGRLWDTGQVVTAAGYLGLDDTPLESQRRRLWAGQRKAPGRLGPRLNAGDASDKMAGRNPPRQARGGPGP
jgi:predicted metallo-beta-lactamase superfamily hydrolase